MRINNNITAINSHRQYGINNVAIGKNVEKLSSGFRVNRAADDAAGLAISEKMRTQIRGLNMASKNSQDAISLVQTAEGALQSTHNIMQRMRELAVQSASGTNDTDVDRAALDLEFQQLSSEIKQIAETVKFNDMTVFNVGQGSDGTTFTIQSGANSRDITTFSIGGLGVTALRVDAQTSASIAISTLTRDINSLSMDRAKLGAIQNRLEFKIQNLDNSAENLQAAESRIRDVDMAKMMTEFTKNNILFQASTAMLAQANAVPQSVLQLLG